MTVVLAGCEIFRFSSCTFSAGGVTSIGREIGYDTHSRDGTVSAKILFHFLRDFRGTKRRPDVEEEPVGVAKLAFA
jgi:hypothetical protein